jgi:hypothetical protein
MPAFKRVNMKRLWVLLVGCALFAAPVSASAFGNWNNHDNDNHHYEGSYKKSHHWFFKHKKDYDKPSRPVPEPSAIALFGAGALAVGWTVRKQLKK